MLSQFLIAPLDSPPIAPHPFVDRSGPRCVMTLNIWLGFNASLTDGPCSDGWTASVTNLVTQCPSPITMHTCFLLSVYSVSIKLSVYPIFASLRRPYSISHTAGSLVLCITVPRVCASLLSSQTEADRSGLACSIVVSVNTSMSRSLLLLSEHAVLLNRAPRLALHRSSNRLTRV